MRELSKTREAWEVQLVNGDVVDLDISEFELAQIHARKAVWTSNLFVPLTSVVHMAKKR
jgi:hypothetical protein